MKLRLTIFALLIGISVFAQGSPEPPYKRFPKNIPLDLLLADSTTRISINDLDRRKPILLMLFSPDCEHCKTETRNMVSQAGRFRKIQVVMATISPLAEMRQFYHDFGLSEMPSLVVGRDVNYMLPSYYNIKFFPFFAFYNKKKDLIGVHEGSITIEEVLAKFE